MRGKIAGRFPRNPPVVNGAPVLVDDVRQWSAGARCFVPAGGRGRATVWADADAGRGAPRGRYGRDWVSARALPQIDASWTGVPFADPGPAFRYGFEDRCVWAFRCPGGGWSLGRFLCTDEETGRCELVQVFRASSGAGGGQPALFLHPSHDKEYGEYGVDFGLVLSPKNARGGAFCYSRCDAFVRHPACPSEWMGVRRSGGSSGPWVADSYPRELPVPEPLQSRIGMPAYFGTEWVTRWQISSGAR